MSVAYEKTEQCEKISHLFGIFCSSIEFIQYEELLVIRSRGHFLRGLPSISINPILRSFKAHPQSRRLLHTTFK